MTPTPLPTPPPCSLPTLLAWRPFLDPLPLELYWLWLAIPLVALISVAYKAIRLDDLQQLPKHAARMSVEILLLLTVAAVVLWLITEAV